MLSSLKKRSDKSSAVMVPAWHPNFRIAERLPDTKAVRTSFFINALAIFAAAALALYVGYAELQLKALRDETARALADVRGSKAGSDRALAEYKKFQEEERKILELKSFLAASKLVVSDFIFQLGETLPPEITLGSIDYRPAAVTLRGAIEGAADEASGRAVQYVEALRGNASFAHFDSIKLTNIVRDPGTGRMQFVIDLAFKAPAKPAVKGRK